MALNLSKYKSNAKSLVVVLFLLLLALWFFLAFLRTGYNFSKVVTEETTWLSLPDEEKRIRMFGDTYSFLKFVEQNTPKTSSIVFLAPGGKAYYLARYFLYPRMITYIKNPEQITQIIDKNNFNYLIFYQSSEKDINENNSINWKLPFAEPENQYINSQKGTKGGIYKL